MWVNNPARSLMSISALPAGSTSSPNDPTSTDVRVKTLQAKIQDWATCPTTDPQTKKEIVGKLQQQLDVVKASIKSEQSKKSEQVCGRKGLEGRLPSGKGSVGADAYI
jgi:hypothetical protein